MIKTKKATEKYLENQKRPVLNKIVLQHNIIGVSRMNIHDLRHLMLMKRVHEYDPTFKEPKYLLRSQQVQVSSKVLKQNVQDEKNKTVHYVKEVIKKNKTIKSRDEQITDYEDLIKTLDDQDAETSGYIKELEKHTVDLEKHNQLLQKIHEAHKE